MAIGLELSNHPQASDAIKIINLMKAVKQRELDANPNILRGDGSIEVAPGSSSHKIRMSVIARILEDAGLRFVFEKLAENKWYVNPVAGL